MHGKEKGEGTDFYITFLLQSPTGEGNGTPLQCSCLENHMDRGAWWAAAQRVAQSWTRLKRLSMHACIGEGNGSPLQCSCLENPRDRGAWWAAVYGVAQSWTRLKRLSSSSENFLTNIRLDFYWNTDKITNTQNCKELPVVIYHFF